MFPEATDRLFVRLANGLCPRDESALELSNDAEHDSDWKKDLKFIVPVGVCVFVLGCAGLVYLVRKKKKEEVAKTETTTDTPKAEEKEDPSSLPYVLTVHPV
eukprot:jgi/Phyca11/559752/estExt2_Genewise1.C_PHYCAscaffold_40052